MTLVVTIGGGRFQRFSCTFSSSLQGGTLALFCFFIRIYIGLSHVESCASQLAERMVLPRYKGNVRPASDLDLASSQNTPCPRIARRIAMLLNTIQGEQIYSRADKWQQGTVGAKEETWCPLTTKAEYIHSSATEA